MVEKLLLEEVRPIGVLTLEDKLPFPSYQATFFSIRGMPGHLAKIYSHDYIASIDLHLEKEPVRSGILRTERIFATALSDNYPVDIRAVQFSNQEGEDTALIKPLIRPGDFLNIRIEDGDLPIGIWTRIGVRVADFHFNRDLVGTAPIRNYARFLSELMNEEARLLIRAYPEKRGEIIKMDRIIQEFIVVYAGIINKRHKITGYPLDTHGDFELINLALSEKRGLIVDDPAPKDEWKINDPFMDIFFLIEDLRTAGYFNEAEELLIAYQVVFLELTRQNGINNKDLEAIKESNALFVLFSEVYRRTNFLRLAKLRGQPRRQQRSYILLQEAYDEVKKRI